MYKENRGIRVSILFGLIIMQLVAKAQFLIEPVVLDSILKSNGCIFHKEFTYLAFCESGLQNKNLFGMHHPYSRKTYSIAKYGQVARFVSIEDSIKDFLLWYNIALPYSHETFIEYIKRRRYNHNPEYYQKLEYVINKNKFRL